VIPGFMPHAKVQRSAGKARPAGRDFASQRPGSSQQIPLAAATSSSGAGGDHGCGLDRFLGEGQRCAADYHEARRAAQRAGRSRQNIKIYQYLEKL